MSAIFISYRRADSKHFTGRMYDRLRSELGRDAVFKDVDSIPAGSDFPTVLNERLRRCQVALVIIGRHWTAAREDDGTRRLDNPNDFVRIEVETVLRRGIPVIPVLIDGADFPAARDLPASLRDLLRRNAVEVEDDPRFDTDMARLARTLSRLLTPTGDAPLGPTEGPIAPRAEHPPAPTDAPAERSSVEDSSALVGRDRAWPEIARVVSKGQLRVVLFGPDGIGKTSTARAFALWHSRGVAPLIIDATAEFDELTLIETVGRAFPHELYRAHDGVPFVALPFGTQRQLAIQILVRHRAGVIIDNPGRAEYPRDPTAESRLAAQLAAELAAKSVLVLVATALLAGWEDCNPIALQGLSPEHGRELVQGVLAGGAKPCSVEEAARLGGPDEFEQLLARGNPRELIQFAERVANTLTPRADARAGGFGRAGGWIRRAAEGVLGDPVHPTPRADREGPGTLFAVCIAMLLIALASLIWSYESGSRYWERMFYRVATRESDVPPLPAVATKVSPGSGLLIEFARAVIVIIFFFLAVIGRFFAHELTALRPRVLWAGPGPRTLGLRSAFRLVFLVLAVWLGYSTVVHHLSVGPRTLWMCNGNPYLQKHLEAGDAAKVRELQNRPNDAPDKMNAEPPRPGELGYEQYRVECARPYLRYYPYSFIMFVIVGPTVMTVCFYSVCSSLWMHLILQPRRVECLADLTPLTEVENRVRHYKKTYAENIDKYLILLLLLLGCWSYHLWLDRYNLTESADDHTTLVLVVAVTVWAGLFSVLLMAYQVLIRQAARRFPEGAPREEFEARHASFRFFRKTVGGSGYTWLCLIPVLISASWYVAAVYFGWQR
jgi:hypothetical protein